MTSYVRIDMTNNVFTKLNTVSINNVTLWMYETEVALRLTRQMFLRQT